MIVETSALAAMLLDEGAARVLAARLQRSQTRLVTPLAVTEAVSAVSAHLNMPAGKAGEEVQRFLDLLGIKVVSLPAQLPPLAAEAMERYGRSAERPAGLTASDCIAYASARYFRQPLLYAHPRFAETDIEPA